MSGYVHQCSQKGVQQGGIHDANPEHYRFESSCKLLKKLRLISQSDETQPPSLFEYIRPVLVLPAACTDLPALCPALKGEYLVTSFAFFNGTSRHW